MSYQKALLKLYSEYYGESVIKFTPLPLSGSSRRYFRMTSKNHTCIGAYNADERENRAFIYLSKHFKKNKLNVPAVLHYDNMNGVYLQQDLGDETLFSRLNKLRHGSSFPEQIKKIYRQTIMMLPDFQIKASGKLDYSKCYPRASFDFQSIMWDLNYFKYYFLKPLNIQFDEQKLENDFVRFANYLLKADSNYFLYRDFNSRNVMINNEVPFFIDYQGGRKGALQYDIASFLYDSKANIPDDFRNELLNDYLFAVNKIKKIDGREFKKYYEVFVLIRLLQMFGAYGFRGIVEGKSHFIQSIPFAVENLSILLSKNRAAFSKKIGVKYLIEILESLVKSEEVSMYKSKSKKNKLTVTITSFSYRKKMPVDYTGNGGGFVFDCRAIPNPGRIDQYKTSSGKDKNVQQFLAEQLEANEFLKNSIAVVEKSVGNYIKRDWKDLMVNFGCTGGQHRSVYCAEILSKHLKNKYDVNVKLIHTNQKSWSK